MCNLQICWTHSHSCRPPCWKRFPLEEPRSSANAPPCQRQRGFKTAGLGRLHHLQAIFQAIHLSRIIERPILSTPGGVTSYHKPPAPLLIKRDGRIGLGRIVKKKGRRTDGRTAWTSAVFTLRGEGTTARRQIARCSLLTGDKFGLITSPHRQQGSGCCLTGFRVVRWGTKHQLPDWPSEKVEQRRQWSRVDSAALAASSRSLPWFLPPLHILELSLKLVC